MIVGGGLAAGKAAEALREHGHSGPLVIIGDEPEKPYVRPPLSKGYLLGKEERDAIFVHPDEWYREHDVDLLLNTRARAVDRRARKVELDDGREVGMSVNVWDVMDPIRSLITSGSDIDDGLLSGPDVPVEHLLP
ncbi:FAD-dependent oxidoreductase [Streptomyces sp. AK02-01A]|uniref:FAD-dependent oxidoreductase n=1 Tax=Streptomyces sp. AK02-01A TaxID=3028648 RepID=UPI0039F66112